MPTSPLEKALDKDIQENQFGRALSDVQKAKPEEIEALPEEIRKHVATAFRAQANIMVRSNTFGIEDEDPINNAPLPLTTDFSDDLNKAADRLSPAKKGRTY